MKLTDAREAASVPRGTQIRAEIGRDLQAPNPIISHANVREKCSKNMGFCVILNRLPISIGNFQYLATAANAFDHAVKRRVLAIG